MVMMNTDELKQAHEGVSAMLSGVKGMQAAQQDNVIFVSVSLEECLTNIRDGIAHMMVTGDSDASIEIGITGLMFVPRDEVK